MNRVFQIETPYLQLRNLLWPTSKHDVYLVQSYSVTHWSALLRRGREVLNVAGRLAPTQVCVLRRALLAYFRSFVIFFSFSVVTCKYCLPAVQNVKGAGPLSRVQISAMAVKDNLMVAGGFQGELICKVSLVGVFPSLLSVLQGLSLSCLRMHSLVRQYVDRPGVAFCTNLTGGSSSITNAVDIHQAPR